MRKAWGLRRRPPPTKMGRELESLSNLISSIIAGSECVPTPLELKCLKIEIEIAIEIMMSPWNSSLFERP